MKKKGCKTEEAAPKRARGGLFNVAKPARPSDIVTFAGVRIAGTGIRLVRDVVQDGFDPNFDRKDLTQEMVARGTMFTFESDSSSQDSPVMQPISVHSGPERDWSTGFRLARDLWSPGLVQQRGMTYVSSEWGMKNNKGDRRIREVKDHAGKYVSFRLARDSGEEG